MKHMYVLLILLFISRVVYTQEIKKPIERVSFGVNMNHQMRENGVGINFTSPLWGQKMKSAIRLAYNFHYLEHLDGNTKVVWTNYMNVKLGYVLALNPINDFFRFYTELGGIILFPNSVFSEKSTIPGIYGMYGFEFLLFSEKKLASIYIELGVVTTGARAEKVITEPIYSHGFSLSVGVRLFFKSRDN